jgi:hypothetical protein
MVEQNAQAYFLLRNGQHSGYRAVLTPNNDVEGLALMPNSLLAWDNSVTPVTGFTDEILVLTIIGPELQANLEELAECEDWQSLEAVFNLDIIGKYAGREYSDKEHWGLFSFLPQLQGQVQTGIDEETGDLIMQDIVRCIRWP